jgi:small subunit ribosomal protein S16
MRVGKKKQPSYRVVVADARSPRDGRIIETIGHYGPLQEPSLIDIDDDKALAWLRKGAQPSEQVQKLLAVTGVWATFEAEKGRPAVTSLSRRAYVTGRGPATTKKSKKAEAAEESAPSAPAAVEAPPADDQEAAPAAEAEGSPSGAEPTSSEAAPEAEAPEAEAPAAEAAPTEEAAPAEETSE